MRVYTVVFRQPVTGPAVIVEAEDVELDVADSSSTAFWNFIAHEHDVADAITVAAFPFTDVARITSEKK